jgi:cation:H+ antiporter
MYLTLLLFFVGFYILIKSADILVDGASSIAKKFGLSNLMIGLTIVAFGTSAPELAVSLFSAFQGSTELAIGNIIGSNIANIGLILGISAIVGTLKVQSSTVWKEIPLSLMAVILLFVQANDLMFGNATSDLVSRGEGIVLLCFFIVFIYYTFSLAKSGDDEGEQVKERKNILSILMIILGITGLTLGGRWIVDGAIEIATFFGISESLIGLTVVAVGTSLPELATSVVATYRGKTDIAVGNVVGSNIFNVLWILGASAIIKPLPFSNQMNFDLIVAVAITVLLFIMMFAISNEKEAGGKTTQVLKRPEGMILLIFYVTYIAYIAWRG